MATSTENFDWSVLTRNSIITLMHTLSPEIVKQPLTIDQFHKKVTTLLKKYIPVRVRKTFSPKVYSGFVFVGGCYYSGYDED